MEKPLSGHVGHPEQSLSLLSNRIARRQNLRLGIEAELRLSLPDALNTLLKGDGVWIKLLLHDGPPYRLLVDTPRAIRDDDCGSLLAV